MKVLLVNKFHYMKGGSEKYYFTLADAFKQKGHEVIFFAMKDEKNFPCDQEKYFVENSSKDGGIKSKLKMITHLVYSKEAYSKMKELLIKENPDLVILNLVHKQITCSIIDAIKEYNKNLPIFWTMHDLICVCPSYTMLDGNGNICEECLDGNFKHCFDKKCIHGSKLMSYLSAYEANKIKQKNWYNKIDLFICPSEFYKNMLEKANFTSSKIVCMRNPLPLDSKYEINDYDEGYILYFGRLSYEKGVKSLINAMKSINYKLFIVGTGPIEEELKRFVEVNKIGNVEFKGFQTGEALTNYIKGSRCVVLPSEWYENGPYSAMEAMALGKPLIVSNIGGLPELVDNGKNGYIYSKIDELPKLLAKIIKIDNAEYKKMCESSMIIAKSFFDGEKYIDDLESWYNDVL